MPLYYIETRFGCGIREAANIKQARSNLLKEVGTHGGPGLCRKATKEDVGWVQSMGGYVPENEKINRTVR